MTRILVVDDEPQILRALRINLRARGYDVDVADTGATALKAAAAHPPDLVVLDLGLPDMDGTEVIGGLRGWSGVPIIVLSGRAGSEEKVAALDAGADDYVTKPFGIDELLARIRAVTRRVGGETGDTVPAARIGRHTIDLAARTVTTDDGAAGYSAGLEGGYRLPMTSSDSMRSPECADSPGAVPLRGLFQRAFPLAAAGQAVHARPMGEGALGGGEPVELRRRHPEVGGAAADLVEGDEAAPPVVGGVLHPFGLHRTGVLPEPYGQLVAGVAQPRGEPVQGGDQVGAAPAGLGARPRQVARSGGRVAPVDRVVGGELGQRGRRLLRR